MFVFLQDFVYVGRSSMELQKSSDARERTNMEGSGEGHEGASAAGNKLLKDTSNSSRLKNISPSYEKRDDGSRETHNNSSVRDSGSRKGGMRRENAATDVSGGHRSDPINRNKYGTQTAMKCDRSSSDNNPERYPAKEETEAIASNSTSERILLENSGQDMFEFPAASRREQNSTGQRFKNSEDGSRSSGRRDADKYRSSRNSDISKEGYEKCDEERTEELKVVENVRSEDTGETKTDESVVGPPPEMKAQTRSSYRFVDFENDRRRTGEKSARGGYNSRRPTTNRGRGSRSSYVGRFNSNDEIERKNKSTSGERVKNRPTDDIRSDAYVERERTARNDSSNYHTRGDRSEEKCKNGDGRDEAGNTGNSVNESFTNSCDEKIPTVAMEDGFHADESKDDPPKPEREKFRNENRERRRRNRKKSTSKGSDQMPNYELSNGRSQDASKPAGEHGLSNSDQQNEGRTVRNSDDNLEFKKESFGRGNSRNYWRRDDRSVHASSASKPHSSKPDEDRVQFCKASKEQNVNSLEPTKGNNSICIEDSGEQTRMSSSSVPESDERKNSRNEGRKNSRNEGQKNSRNEGRRNSKDEGGKSSRDEGGRNLKDEGGKSLRDERKRNSRDEGDQNENDLVKDDQCRSNKRPDGPRYQIPHHRNFTDRDNDMNSGRGSNRRNENRDHDPGPRNRYRAQGSFDGSSNSRVFVQKTKRDENISNKPQRSRYHDDRCDTPKDSVQCENIVIEKCDAKERIERPSGHGEKFRVERRSGEGNDSKRYGENSHSNLQHRDSISTRQHQTVNSSGRSRHQDGYSNRPRNHRDGKYDERPRRQDDRPARKPQHQDKNYARQWSSGSSGTLASENLASANTSEISLEKSSQVPIVGTEKSHPGFCVQGLPPNCQAP